MTAVADRPASTAPTAPAYELLPIAQVVESPLNPRKRFDAGKLAQLADSIRTVGIYTPLLVRPAKGGRYEIGSGHRRYRAAKAAGLTELPCFVRPMDDVAFLELLLIDNDQRDDVHPLEEAQGYVNLMQAATGYDIAKVATRVGRPKGYVYDRVRLLKLIPAAQALFLADRFPLGHAIELARLSKDDQEQAIHPDGAASAGGRNGGIWEYDHPELDEDPDDADDDPYARLKPVSLGEFRAYINHHVRFDPAAETVPELFPATATALQEARAAHEATAGRKRRIAHVAITYEHQLHPDARDDKERTIGPASWERADGQEGSKTCDHSILGVVVAGPRRSAAFDVCLDKEKCPVHWVQWRKERDARRRSAKRDAPVVSPAEGEARLQRVAQENREREIEDKALEAAEPKILDALAATLKTAPVAATSPVGKYFLDRCLDWGVNPRAIKIVGYGKDAASLVRAVVFSQAFTDVVNAHSTDVYDEIKRLGVNAKALIEAERRRILKETAPTKAKPAKVKTKGRRS